MRRGVARATLEEIAEEAGVTRGAIYWHFKNKIAILRAMNERVRQPLDTMFEQLTSSKDPLTDLNALLLHVFERLEKDEHARNVFTIARLRHEDLHCSDNEYGQEMRTKRDTAIKKFTAIYTRIARTHPLAEGVTPKIAALQTHSFVSGVFWDYLTRPDLYPITKIAPLQLACFFRGILR